jgi:hypothetical protein
VKLKSMPVFLFLAAAAVVLAFTSPNLLGMATSGDDTVKITFDVRLGDGVDWCGGADILYTIGGTGYPVRLQALRTGDRRKNTWVVTKDVKKGTAISLAARPEWQGIPVTVRFRGLKVTPRPVSAVGRDTARISTFVT